MKMKGRKKEQIEYRKEDGEKERKKRRTREEKSKKQLSKEIQQVKDKTTERIEGKKIFLEENSKNRIKFLQSLLDL